jgi:hypothetical protein
MKRVMAVALIAMLLLPGAAYAGSGTDAALGLGAFAALGTLLLGAAIFGGHPAVAAPEPVYVPQPPVVYQPAPVYAPPPPVVYAPPPVYAPAPPVVYTPRPVYRQTPVYRPAPVYRQAPVYREAPVYAPAPGHYGYGRHARPGHWQSN